MSDIKIGRVASSNPTGLTPVKGFNRPAGNSMADIFAANGVNPNTLKRQVTPKLTEISGRDLLNQQITAKMDNASQYGGKTVKVGDKFVSQTAAQTQAAEESIQAGKQLKTQIGQTLAQPTKITAEGIDAGLGIGRQAKSAQESMGVFVKNDLEQISKQTSNLNAKTIDNMFDIGKEAKSAQESMGAFVKNDIEQISKQTSNLNAETIDNMLGIGKEAKSAQESMGVFTKADIEQISQRARFSPSELSNIGMGRTARSAEESAEVFLENGEQKTGFFKKLFGKTGEFFKGVGNKISSIWKSGALGKLGLIAAGAAILGAIGYGIYSLFAGDDDKKAKDVDFNKIAEENQAVDPKEKEETALEEEEVTPVVDSEEKEETVPEEEEVTPVVDPEENEEASNIYTVQKGDCVWNIAKQHLEDIKEDDEEKVTNKRTLKHTKEIMKKNNLHFEPDNYHVMIRPGDKLELPTPEEDEEEVKENKKQENK